MHAFSTLSLHWLILCHIRCTNISSNKMHCNAVIVCVNGMWQLGFKSVLCRMEIWTTSLYCNYISWLTCFFLINSAEISFELAVIVAGIVYKCRQAHFKSNRFPLSLLFLVINFENHVVTKICLILRCDVINGQHFTNINKMFSSYPKTFTKRNVRRTMAFVTLAMFWNWKKKSL